MTAIVPSSTSESSTALPVTAIVVGDEIGPLLEGEVLWTASVGDGTDQIGLPPGGCEGCGPWSPIVFGGTIVVLDQQNRRWVSVHSDKSTAVDALEPGSVSAGQPRLAPDGLVYAPFRLDNAPGPDGTPTWVVRGFDPENLDAEVVEIPIGGAMYTITEVVADELVVNGSPVNQLVEGDPATVEIHGNTVTIDSATTRTEWTFPANWGLGLQRVLSDTSVVLRGPDARIIVLATDGTWATGRTTGINYGNNGEITIDDNGIVQIELIDNTWHIIRYPLPSV